MTTTYLVQGRGGARWVQDVPEDGGRGTLTDEVGSPILGRDGEPQVGWVDGPLREMWNEQIRKGDLVIVAEVPTGSAVNGAGEVIPPEPRA